MPPSPTASCFFEKNEKHPAMPTVPVSRPSAARAVML